MRTYNMVVSKKEANIKSDGTAAYVEVGNILVYYPELSELSDTLPAASKYQVQDKDGKWADCVEDTADAFPIYADERMDMLFQAVWASVKATARNRLKSGTAQLKDGARIDSTLEEMLEVTGRNGEALAIRREYFASFKAFLPSLGKTAAWVQGIYDIVSNVKNLPYQSEARKTAIVGFVGQHASSLSTEDVAKWDRVISSILEAAQTADPLA